MATLQALIKIGADISDLQSKSSQAVHALDTMEKNSTRVTSALGSMGKALVDVVSVAAISNAVRSFTDLTGQLTDLSAKTGISTTELQKLKFAAEQNGATLEQVTKSIGFLARALHGDDKSIVPLFKRLGLSLDEIRSMQPGEAFAAIEEAVSKLPNPMERSAIQTKLLGKAGADLLPMAGTLRATMEAAERLGIVLDTQTVKAGDDLGDALTVLQTVGSALIAKVLVPMLPALIQAAQWLGNAAQAVTWLQERFQDGIVWGLKFAKAVLDTAIAVQEAATKIPFIGRAIGAADQAAIDAAKSMSTWLDDTIKGMQVEIPKAAEPVRKLGDAIRPLKDDSERAAKGLKQLTDAAEDLVTRGIKAATKAQLEQNTVMMAALSPLQALIHSNRELYGTQLQLLDSTKFLADANARTTATLQDMASKGMFMNAVTVSHAEFVKNATSATLSWRDQLKDTGLVSDMFSQGIRGMSAVLAEYRDTSRGALDNVSSYWQGHAQATQGVIKVMQGDISGFVDIVVGTARQIASAWNFIKGIFNRDKGRDLVEDFAAGFGGFESLHRQLLKLGDAVGEQLWIKLTQGVGRNNAEQARAAIEEVRKALEALGASANNFPGITIPVDYEGLESGIASTTYRPGEMVEHSFAGGSGGIRDFGQGTLAMLHGREGVYTEGQVAALRGRSDTSQTIVVQIDRDTILRTVHKGMPQYLAIRGA